MPVRGAKRRKRPCGQRGGRRAIQSCGGGNRSDRRAEPLPRGVDKAMRIFVSTVVAALSLAAFSVGSVSAAPTSTDKVVHIVGGETFSPDEFFSITYHFFPRRTRVHQGDRITWENQTTDGHTVSVVTREQLPKTVQQIDNCSACNDLLAAHFRNGFPPQGTPVLVLDDFKATTAPARFDSVRGREWGRISRFDRFGSGDESLEHLAERGGRRRQHAGAVGITRDVRARGAGWRTVVARRRCAHRDHWHALRRVPGSHGRTRVPRTRQPGNGPVQPGTTACLFRLVYHRQRGPGVWRTL